MDRLGKPLERREFLKKGIMGGVLFITIPPGKVLQTGTMQQETDSLKLLQVARRYGGEFGDTRGGL